MADSSAVSPRLGPSEAVSAALVKRNGLKFQNRENAPKSSMGEGVFLPRFAAYQGSKPALAEQMSKRRSERLDQIAFEKKFGKKARLISWLCPCIWLKAMISGRVKLEIKKSTPTCYHEKPKYPTRVYETG